jgi:hypothetical protein
MPVVVLMIGAAYFKLLGEVSTSKPLLFSLLKINYHHRNEVLIKTLARRIKIEIQVSID